MIFMGDGEKRPIEALILAGRREGERDPLADVENVQHKALLHAGGKALISRVVSALSESGRVGVIRIAAPEDIHAAVSDALSEYAGWSFVKPASSPAATILPALEEPATPDGLLVTTCDHALLTPEMIRHFLDDSSGAQAAAACVERSAYETRFPASKRTFIKLNDFSFSGANLFWFADESALPLAAFWRRLEQKRKNPFSMAAEIGVTTAISYLTGAMSKKRLEKILEKKTGVRAQLVSLTMAEAAIDVDKPADLALVRSILGDETQA